MDKKDIQAAPKKKLSQRKGYKIYKKIRGIIFTLLFITAAGVLVLTMISRLSGNTPAIFGYSVFRVSSGSMKPAYEIGDVIIVRECDPKELKVGDVCTYNGTTGDFAGKIITHRVIEAEFAENGENYIKTKGDANLIEDPKVNVKNVVGRVERKIDVLRLLYNFFITPWGLLTIIALIIAAFFNEIINFVKALLGLGYKEENESVEDIIARYQNNNEGKDEPSRNNE